MDAARAESVIRAVEVRMMRWRELPPRRSDARQRALTEPPPELERARTKTNDKRRQGWRAAVASGAAAWDAAARALAALQDGGEEQEVPAVAGGDRHRDAVMRVYEELMQEVSKR